MRKCGICNLYVESEAKFCPYCGKRIYTAVSTEFEDEEVKLKSEEYKYNGEIRERYQVVGENGEKIFSFVPDFMVHEFTDGWIYRDELWMSVRYSGKYKVYKIPVNGKKSKLIAEFGWCGGTRRCWRLRLPNRKECCKDACSTLFVSDAEDQLINSIFSEQMK